MLDTIVVSRQQWSVPPGSWSERYVSDSRGVRHKLWREESGVFLEVSDRSAPLVRATFSVPRILQCGYHHNPTIADIQQAIEHVSNVVGDDIRDWTVSRLDCCWNFEVGAQLPEYLALVRSLQLGSYVRQSYAPDEGVVWKSASRWVKFYDAYRRHGADGVLRFEVSNHRPVLVQMCRGWFGCERTLSSLVHPGRIAFILCYVWQRLGLHQADYYSEWSTMQRCRTLYGRGAMTAYYVWCAVRQHGAAARRLMSEDVYYSWRKRLIHDGLMSVVEGADHVTAPVLGGISVPVRTLMNLEKSVLARQDLEGTKGAAYIPPEKIAPDALEKLKKLAGIKPEVKLPGSFLDGF